MKNKRNTEEDGSISASIDESSTDDDSYNVSISKSSLKDIWYGIQIHPDINARYYRLKMRDFFKQTQSEWEVVALSEKRTVKALHKIFKVVVN